MPPWVRICRHGIDLLFPPSCACCDQEMAGCEDSVLLCGECRSALGPQEWPVCRHCGLPVAASEVERESCPACRPNLAFQRVVPLGRYDGELRSAVLRMKRPSGRALVTAVTDLFHLRRRSEMLQTRLDLVVPVPMFWTRRLIRGVNGPELIARRLARLLGVPVARRILVRCRNTCLQKDLSPTRRFENVRGAFRVRSGYNLKDRRVLLVDDVMTTGATCSEAARVLRRAGAVEVVAAVVGRAEAPKAS